ncbi:MAG: nucleotide exchange factor GrpE [Spirochaetes bacterium]|nr:nucleotide exchange factor GrpE [Spirochaetota bacterium]
MSKGKVKNADSVAEEEKVQTQSENDENAEELSDLEVLQKKNIELESKVKEYENLIKRQQAEFENFRKRTRIERDDFRKTAVSDVFTDLLEVIDNFERAIASGENSTDFKGYKNGIEMIDKQFRDFLKKHGVEQYESLNKPFDPQMHQAMMMVEEGDHDGQKISEVFKQGFMIHDKMLRPASVKVAKGSGQSVASVDTEVEAEG